MEDGGVGSLLQRADGIIRWKTYIPEEREEGIEEGLMRRWEKECSVPTDGTNPTTGVIFFGVLVCAMRAPRYHFLAGSYSALVYL